MLWPLYDDVYVNYKQYSEILNYFIEKNDEDAISQLTNSYSKSNKWIYKIFNEKFIKINGMFCYEFLYFVKYITPPSPIVITKAVVDSKYRRCYYKIKLFFRMCFATIKNIPKDLNKLLKYKNKNVIKINHF